MIYIRKYNDIMIAISNFLVYCHEYNLVFNLFYFRLWIFKNGTFFLLCSKNKNTLRLRNNLMKSQLQQIKCLELVQLLFFSRTFFTKNICLHLFFRRNSLDN